MSRIAVVLFNLGGPDGPRAVRPFLRNLFADPAIIAAPGPLRWLLSELISRSREPSAKANYAYMGGGSPLNAETEAQAKALAARLGKLRPDDQIGVFTAMRYWRPLTEDAAAGVTAFGPDEVVLLPLYPQFSTTTTASSLAAWDRIYAGEQRSRAVCCYFEDGRLARAHADRIMEAWREAGAPKSLRLLFSAHGLPERISNAGDPYRWQVEATCAKVAALLPDLPDWRVCYQSRVGPMSWIGPSTLEEIERAGSEGLGVLVDPVAFVSEHIETLVELDRDYAEAAARARARPYIRAKAIGTHPEFIECLAQLAQAALARPGVAPGGRACPTEYGRCALRRTEAA